MLMRNYPSKVLAPNFSRKPHERKKILDQTVLSAGTPGSYGRRTVLCGKNADRDSVKAAKRSVSCAYRKRNTLLPAQ